MLCSGRVVRPSKIWRGSSSLAPPATDENPFQFFLLVKVAGIPCHCQLIGLVLGYAVALAYTHTHSTQVPSAHHNTMHACSRVHAPHAISYHIST